jgi:hypothetical protein
MHYCIVRTVRSQNLWRDPEEQTALVRAGLKQMSESIKTDLEPDGTPSPRE